MCEERIHRRRILLQRFGAGPDRSEGFDHRIGETPLAVEAPPPSRPALEIHFGDGVRRGEFLVVRKDIAERGGAGVLPGNPRRIGGRRPELFPDLLRRVEHPDRVAQALRHLGVAVEAHDPLGGGQQRLRLRKPGRIGRVRRVPAPGDFPRQLEVLYLVLAHRHRGGVVQEDVRRLEDGIAEQAGRNALESFGLIFELGHALELTERRHRGQEPVELRVLGHRRLNEQNRAVRVDAGGEQPDRHISRSLRQRGDVVGNGHGVKIHHAVHAIELIL